MPHTTTTYGQRLLEALKAAGKSRRQLATALGITEQAVGNIINGKETTFFMANNSAEAAAFLDVDHYWLATGKGQMELRGTDWPFKSVALGEVRELNEVEVLQLEGALRMMLTHLFQHRHGSDGNDPAYKVVGTLSGRGPVEEVPPDLRALAERQRQLEEAVRNAGNLLREAVAPPPGQRKDPQA